MQAIIKTPLFIGGDVTQLPPHSLRTYLNREVIAINQDPLVRRTSACVVCGLHYTVRRTCRAPSLILSRCCTPAPHIHAISSCPAYAPPLWHVVWLQGIPGRQVTTAQSPTGEVWAVLLTGGSAAAVLLNRGATAVNVTVHWSGIWGNNSAWRRSGARHTLAVAEAVAEAAAYHTIPYHAASSPAATVPHVAAVRDLWQHKDLGNFTSHFTTLVPPQSAVSVKVQALVLL